MKAALRSASQMKLTHQYLRQLVFYDPSAGTFVWRDGRNKGLPAGFGYARKRLQICISGSNYYAHRLAWLYIHEYMPDGVVDHINGDPMDNRIDNLRVVTQRANTENRRKAQRNSTTGILGISPRRGRFRAAIKVSGTTIHIGTYDTAEEAHAAYLEKKRHLHAGCTI